MSPGDMDFTEEEAAAVHEPDAMEFTEEEAASVYEPDAMEFTEEEVAFVETDASEIGECVPLRVGSPQRMVMVNCDGLKVVRFCRAVARLAELSERATLDELAAEPDDNCIMTALHYWFPIVELQLPSPTSEFLAAVDARANELIDAFAAALRAGPREFLSLWAEQERRRDQAFAHVMDLASDATGQTERNRLIAQGVGGLFATAKFACDVAAAVIGTTGGVPGTLFGAAYSMATSVAVEYQSSTAGPSDATLLAMAVTIPATGVGLTEAATFAQLKKITDVAAMLATSKADYDALLAAHSISVQTPLGNVGAAASRLRQVLNTNGRLLGPTGTWLGAANQGFGLLSAFLAGRDFANNLRDLGIVD